MQGDSGCPTPELRRVFGGVEEKFVKRLAECIGSENGQYP
jgi:hypothetical protein